MPSAKPVWPCSVRSCRTLFKRSGSLWWAMWFWMLDVFATPQQETNVARPRPVFRARTVITPLGFGCARLATLAFAPPHPRGVMTEGRKTIYRKTFTPTRPDRQHRVQHQEAINQIRHRKRFGTEDGGLRDEIRF